MVSDYERIDISLQQYKKAVVGKEVKVDFLRIQLVMSQK